MSSIVGQKEGAAVRREKALQLRIKGMSYRRIGDALGVSHVQAFNDVKTELGRIAKESQDAAEELRTLELERLDAMLVAIAPLISASDKRPANLGAIDRALNIMARRAKLLGLDAAEKTEVSGPGGAPITQRQFIEYNKDQLKEILGYREDDES